MRNAALLLSLVLMTACASLPEEIDHFSYAASSPLRDVNVVQQPIPGQLRALQQPYGYAERNGCQAWGEEIAQLQTAIDVNGGRRVGYRRDNESFVGRTGNLRDAAVKSAVSRVLPFRRVVRQVSGAAKYEGIATEASEQARYRIGYLVGLGRAHGCPGFGRIVPLDENTPRRPLMTSTPVRQVVTQPQPRVIIYPQPQAPRTVVTVPPSRGRLRSNRR